LRDNYGTEGASAILSGLTSAILLRSGDPASTDFIRFAIGEEFNEYTGNVEKAQLGGQHRNRQKTVRREKRKAGEHVFSKAEISSWNAGEGVVVRPNSWAYGRVKLID
jgi:type IV secretory pathway TraG/TraD family ATPase VirD4